MSETVNAAVRLQTSARGFIWRRRLLSLRANYLELLREVEGDEVARSLSWGSHLSRPRFDHLSTHDVANTAGLVGSGARSLNAGPRKGQHHLSLETLRSGAPSTDTEAIGNDRPCAVESVESDLSATEQLDSARAAAILQSELQWLKQALHAQRAARRVGLTQEMAHGAEPEP